MLKLMFFFYLEVNETSHTYISAHKYDCIKWRIVCCIYIFLWEHIFIHMHVYMLYCDSLEHRLKSISTEKYLPADTLFQNGEAKFLQHS